HSRPTLSLHDALPICIRAHSALVGLSGVGLGNGRQRASAGVPEEVRLGDGAERSYPPSHAEGRGQCYVSHCLLDSISATAARERDRKSTRLNSSHGSI